MQSSEKQNNYSLCQRLHVYRIVSIVDFVCFVCFIYLPHYNNYKKMPKKIKCRKRWRGGLKETIELMLIRPPQLQFFEDGIKITATDTI